MAVYVTGDTHGYIDLDKLVPSKWELGQTLTKEDYLIILGDFGLLWEHEPTEEHELPLTDFYNTMPWTTLWIPGNHENYDRINALTPIVFDGMRCRTSPLWKSIYMLESGIQMIQGVPCLIYRGGESIDRRRRIAGISWWRDELVGAKEFQEISDNVEEYCNRAGANVDFVLSHTCAKDFFWNMIEDQVIYGDKSNDPTMGQLQFFKEFLAEKGMSTQYYCGHFHEEYRKDNFHCLHNKIERVV